MSWGSLFGALMNTVGFAALWVVLGKFVEVITIAFNRTMAVLPTFQDAANGMNMMQYGWSAIMVIILIMIWLNYIANSGNEANQVA